MKALYLRALFCSGISAKQTVSFRALCSLDCTSNILGRHKAAQMTDMKANHAQGYGSGSKLFSYAGKVQEVEREDRLEQRISSLLELVDATEEDSLFTGLGVIPAYYEQLAIIFRERKEYAKEIAILARYARQKHANGDSRQEILKKRLEKAKKLLNQNKSAL
jgi:hypothetical protein